MATILHEFSSFVITYIDNKTSAVYLYYRVTASIYGTESVW